MKIIFVEKDRCTLNHICPSVEVCPVSAIVQNGLDVPNIDIEKCIVCTVCMKFCPVGAIQTKEY